MILGEPESRSKPGGMEKYTASAYSQSPALLLSITGILSLHGNDI
jgi:hypothetical protein